MLKIVNFPNLTKGYNEDHVSEKECLIYVQQDHVKYTCRFRDISIQDILLFK